MKSYSLALFLSGILLITHSCKKDPVVPELTANFSVTFLSEFQNTIYPSMIFGLTEIEKQQGEPMDYFTIKVNPNIKTDIKIVVQESSLNYETVLTEYGVTGEKIIIPSLKWKFNDLKNLSQPGNVDITFVCFGDNNKEIGRKDLRLSYRAINECVLAAIIDKKQVPLYFMMAAYVNEDSPVIDAFLKEVLQLTTLPAFVGYQQGEDMAFTQVAAVFYALRLKGIKYSNITSTSNSNPNIASQYIRFSDEVLTNTQANCADGTAFFCSVLKKIGIHSLMVFIPGHVYLGYYLDEAKTDLILLETTMVGSTTADFYDATNAENDSFNSNIDNFNNGDYFDGYFLIDVDNARQIIKPIGRKSLSIKSLKF
jgi:hypothetical protein